MPNSLTNQQCTAVKTYTVVDQQPAFLMCLVDNRVPHAPRVSPHDQRRLLGNNSYSHHWRATYKQVTFHSESSRSLLYIHRGFRTLTVNYLLNPNNRLTNKLGRIARYREHRSPQLIQGIFNRCTYLIKFPCMNYVSVAKDECIVRECVCAVCNASENVRNQINNDVWRISLTHLGAGLYVIIYNKFFIIVQRCKN